MKKTTTHYCRASFVLGLMSLSAMIAMNTMAQLPSSVDPTITAPDVWSFMKYGGQTPNLYTGTVSVSIPIYAYKDQDFEIPVSLGYASNGFIPNSSTGPLGLGWILNTGGYITREVVGHPDEYNSGYHSGYLKGYYDYFMYTNKPALSNPIMDRGGWNNTEQQFLFYSDPAAPSLTRPHWETEPDIFTFNFMGHQGKFTLSAGVINVFNTSYPQGEYKIDMSQFIEDIRANPPGHGASKILITTGDGYKYTFSGFPIAPPWSSKRLDQMRKTNDSYSYNTPPYALKTWKLVQIEAPNGRKVKFEYSIPEYVESTRFAGLLRKGEVKYHEKARRHKASMQYMIDNSFELGSVFLVYKYAIATNRLEKITIDNKCEINFSYQPRTKSEIWENPYIATTETIGSVIHYGVPRKENLLGEQQLHKITVNNLIDLGLILKECDLEYGYPNEAGNNVLLLKKVTISGEGSYRMDYNNERDKFPIQCSHSYDHWGYYNMYQYNTSDRGTIRMRLAVPDVTVDENTYVETHNSQNKSPNATGAKYGMLSKLSYPTGGYTTYEYEPHTYSKMVYRDYSSQNIPTLRSCNESEAGGVRIKKIIDYSWGGQIAHSREYIYKNSISNTAKSSGNLLHMPRYWLQTEKIAKKNSSNYYYMLTSTLSITDQMAYSMNGTHIEYSKIYEKYSDGSYIAYGFSNYETMPDQFSTSSSQLSLSPYENIPWTMTEPAYAENFLRYPHSMSSMRGKPITKEYYNAAGVLQKEEINIYDTGKNMRFQESVKSTVPQGVIYYVHKTLTDDFPLIQSTQTDYFTGGQQITQTTEYDYNSLGQLSYTKTTNNAGDLVINQTQYVADAVSEPGRSILIDKNLYGLPIRTQTKVKREGVDTDFKLLTGTYYNYSLASSGGNSFPILNYTRKTNLATPVTCPDFGFNNYLITDDTYSYDTQGNVREITDKNGITTTYLWGYLNVHPVAKIENASYSQVYAKLGNNITDIANTSVLSDSQITLIGSLRQSLPESKVTIYTYRPLVGITSVIDPSGRKTTYQHDDHSRLESVKDDEGNLLNEYEYHFAE